MKKAFPINLAPDSNFIDFNHSKSAGVWDRAWFTIELNEDNFNQFVRLQFSTNWIAVSRKLPIDGLIMKSARNVWFPGSVW